MQIKEMTPIPYKNMNGRRRRLGMSMATLAQRSGVSQPTVVRILTGKWFSPTLPNVQAIAAALGVTLMIGRECRVIEDSDAHEFQRRQAEKKASIIVGMVQGTMGLESQAVAPSVLETMREQTVRDLLAGSRRRLWEE